jgi:hypothetical protein
MFPRERRARICRPNRAKQILANRKRQDMRRSISLAAVALLPLAAGSLLRFEPAASDGAAALRNASLPDFEPFSRRVVVVVVDGWRRADALSGAAMPNVERLAAAGSRGPMTAGMRSFTKPCLRTLFTGRPGSFRDSLLNVTVDRVTEDSLFTRLNGARRAWGSSAYSPDFAELFGDDMREGVARAYVGKRADLFGAYVDDDAVEAGAMRILDDPAAVLALVHFGSVDETGHILKPWSAAYREALAAVDRRIGRIASRLDPDCDAFVVLGDHGADDDGHHGGPDALARETAFLAVGKGFAKGTPAFAPEDFAPTLAILLGVCPPVSGLGAPDPALLSLDPAILKRRCDACLAARFASSPALEKRWAGSPELARYLAAPRFGQAEAEGYRAFGSRSGGSEHPPVQALLGLAMVAVVLGVWRRPA